MATGIFRLEGRQSGRRDLEAKCVAREFVSVGCFNLYISQIKKSKMH